MRSQMLRVLVVILGITMSAAAFSPAQYKLKQKHVLGGEGFWDYLKYDPAGKRLFISRGTHVMVVDPEKGTAIGEIADTAGVHGIALAPDLGKGFTSNGRDNTVTVFDLKTLKETARIKLEAENPDAILYDRFSHRVFTFNGRSHNATVIDAAKNAVIKTIPLDGKPEFGVSDGKGRVFVNIEDKSELTSIDARKGQVVKSWPLAPCQEPTGLAMDQKKRRLFAGCSNKLMAVVDANTGKVITTLPIGQGVDATEFDPITRLAFSSNGEGTLTVVRESAPGKFSVVENAETQKFARTMALNTANHEIYLVTAEFEEAAPAKEGERPRRTMKPGTFTLLVMAPEPAKAAASAKAAAPAKAATGKAAPAAKPAEPAKAAAPAPTATPVPEPAKAPAPAQATPVQAPPAKAAPATPVQAAAPAYSKETEALYKSKCQVCHGADGAGSAAGQKMGVKSFHAPEVSRQSDSELFATAKKGKGKMPAYDGKLTDDQIKDLIKYVRSLK